MRHVLATMTMAGVAGAFAGAEQIVQKGTLSGGGTEPMEHSIVFDQFDDMGGTRTLNFVRLECLTSMIGGVTTDDSGGTITWYGELNADYFLNEEPIAETMAVLQGSLPNQGHQSFTFFNNDTDEYMPESKADVMPWLGDGTVKIDAITSIYTESDPPGYFGGGGSVYYTLIYDFDEKALVGDFNGDGVVDSIDLLQLLGAWGSCIDCPEDLNADDIVDSIDLLMLLGNWS